MRRSDRRLAESMLEGAGLGPFWCSCCKQECALHITDEGIGDYEYWGAKGTDVQLVLSSDCCDSDYTEEDPNEPEDEDDDILDPNPIDLGVVGSNSVD